MIQVGYLYVLRTRSGERVEGPRDEFTVIWRDFRKVLLRVKLPRALWGTRPRRFWRWLPR